MSETDNKKILPEEYNSEFSYNINKSNLKISFERISFIFFVFFIIAIIFSSKVILLSLENKTVKSYFCPIISGTSFLDQIKSLEKLNEIKFEKIGYPLLFLPFVGRASEIIGKRLFLKLDDREFLLNFNNNIYSNFIKNNIIEVANFVSIQFLINTDSFLEKEWNELYKLSEDTFVEETDSLKKSGAGAGLTDND